MHLMHPFVQKIAHLALTALILVSLTGLSVKRHFFMGQHVYSTLSFLGETCMEGVLPADSPCCQDEYAHLQVIEKFQVVNTAISLEAPIAQAMPEVPAALLAVTKERLLPAFRHYRPPLIARDIPVMTGTFLI